MRKSARTILLASIVAVLLAIVFEVALSGALPPSAGADRAHSQQPTSAPSPTPSLTVTPSSGPVGTAVEITGSGCNNPGRPDAIGIVFQNGDSSQGTVGGVGLLNVPTGAGGAFSVSFTIPAQLDTLQGQGGGAVTAGTYHFVTRPVSCVATFTVTSPDLMPSTGGASGERQLPLQAAAIISGLFLSMIGLVTVLAAAKKR